MIMQIYSWLNRHDLRTGHVQLYIKAIHPKYCTHYIFWHTLLIVYAVAYFDHRKYTAKIDSFLSFMLINFLMQTLQ
jgi:hypothetical protein